jgi:hypothetical protein
MLLEGGAGVGVVVDPPSPHLGGDGAHVRVRIFEQQLRGGGHEFGTRQGADLVALAAVTRERMDRLEAYAMVGVVEEQHHQLERFVPCDVVDQERALEAQLRVVCEETLLDGRTRGGAEPTEVPVRVLLPVGHGEVRDGLLDLVLEQQAIRRRRRRPEASETQTKRRWRHHRTFAVAFHHRGELVAAWQKASSGELPGTIEPLS